MPKETLEKILKYYPEEKDKKLILEAFEFAKTAHQSQKRFSGEDYIIHPLRVSLILSQLKLGVKTAMAGILHDVIDDTKVLPQELEKKFGKEISLLVKGVSLLGKLRLPKQNLEIEPIEKKDKKSANFEEENLRRMFFAMAEDIRVILIKLADRTHNMETLEFIPKEKQKRIALETMEIFAPLADRLGIKRIKTKLENLAFPYLYPKEYQWVVDNAKEKHEEARKHLDRAREILKKYLEKENIEFIEIQGRLKSYFSLYRKLMRHNMDFDGIYDLAALRIIVKDIKTCYETLGAIHKYWRPLPGRVKDYIAFPKPNGYQSLHSTVFCEEGKIIEVQIRTQEMHEIAEHGICAHWAKNQGVNLQKQKQAFEWVQQLADWQREHKEHKNPEEFFDSLKIDFFKNRIFVFTPKGDIINLPESATPIDFAYAIHSEIGNHAVGAKVNGKFIHLSDSLHNGDIVEIMLNKKRGPSRDWLKFVRTNLAKSHIKKQTEVNIFKELQELKKRFFPQKQVITVSVDIDQKSTEQEKKEKIPSAVKQKPKVIIGKKTEVAYTLAKCCQPKPADEIVAFLAQIKGKASVHKKDCKNFKELTEKWPQKILEAEWR